MTAKKVINPEQEIPLAGEVTEQEKVEELKQVNKELIEDTKFETPSNSQLDFEQFTPYDKLEVQGRLIEPSWGGPNEYSHAAKEKLIGIDGYQKNIDTDRYNAVGSSLLPIFQILFKKDLRVGNLGTLDNYCEEYIDFSYDCFAAGFPRAATTCQERAISVIEISQSKGGFFRKSFNTFIRKDLKEVREPSDKGLFGKPKENQEGGDF